MIKLVIFAVVLFLIYIVFFKKSRQNNITKKNQDNQIETMSACDKCGTLISKNEAILSNARYYCSKECLK